MLAELWSNDIQLHIFAIAFMLARFINEKHKRLWFSWGLLFLLFLHVAWEYGLRLTELILLPEYCGLLPTTGLLAGWVGYSFLCIRRGGVRFPLRRLRAFVDGTCCGILACSQIYRGQPYALTLAFAGSLCTPLAFPLYFFLPGSLMNIGCAVMVLLIVQPFIKGDLEEEPWGWRHGLIIACAALSCLGWWWLLCVAAGVMYHRPSKKSLELSWSFDAIVPIYLSVVLVGVGWIEGCTRYFEQQQITGAIGFEHELVIFLGVLSLVLDPVSLTLIVQGFWDRMLDIQSPQLQEFVAQSTPSAQLIYLMHKGQSLWKGKWILIAWCAFIGLFYLYM